VLAEPSSIAPSTHDVRVGGAHLGMEMGTLSIQVGTIIATVRVLLLSTFAFLVSVPASADRITVGALIYVQGAGPLTVSLQSESFTFDGRASHLGGVFLPWLQCSVPECVGGTTVDLFSHWSGGDLSGNASLGDHVFTNVGSLAGTSSLFATWTGSLSIPAGFEGGVLTAPFEFTGMFSYFTSPGDFGQLDLFGSGTATATFRPYPCCSDLFPGALALESIRYDFSATDVAPTPEPASVILLGSGLVGILAARARRQRLSS
jgi:hypothetical protein